jgi:hypothetical protein
MTYVLILSAPRPDSRRQLLPQLQRYELGSIVRADVLRHSVLQHHVRQRFDQIVTVQPSCDPQCQTPSGILVDQRQQPKSTSTVGEDANKVVAQTSFACSGPYT